MSAHALVGTKFPSTTVKFSSPVDSVAIPVSEGTHIIVTVPGAATPSCSSQLPAYLQHADAFKAKGVSSISCVTINDFFCVKAWADGMLAKNPVAADSVAVKFYGDDTGALLSSMNLTFDATPLLGNHRAQRAAIVVKDGVITAVHVESDPSAVTVSSAESVLATL